MSNLYWLTEAQILRLRPFFPKSRGRPRVDDRRVLNGIIFINRNGLRGRVVRHVHKITFQLTEVALPRNVFGQILAAIRNLKPPTKPA